MVVIVAVTCSCGVVPVSTNASASRTITPNPPSASGPATPSTAPTPSVQVLANLDCRLPVVWGSVGESTYAGFLSFSSQTLVKDSAATQTVMPNPIALNGFTFYDRAYSKWLPTFNDSVSPDGSRYAYTDGNTFPAPSKGTVHVVDVATGVDHVIYSGSPLFMVVEFASEGVYVTQAEDVPHGLWLINPSGGQPRLISSTILHPKVGNGAAWGLDFNSADPHPGPGGMIGPQNEILRYDLRSGASTLWLFQPGASFDTYGLGSDYSGNLFISNRPDLYSYEIVEVAADATSRVVYLDSDTQSEKQAPSSIAAVDSYGVWFQGNSFPGGVGSVWLASGGRLQEVATFSPDVGDVVIAGGCIPGRS